MEGFGRTCKIVRTYGCDKWRVRGREPRRQRQTDGLSKRVLFGPMDGAEGIGLRYSQIEPGGNRVYTNRRFIRSSPRSVGTGCCPGMRIPTSLRKT